MIAIKDMETIPENCFDCPIICKENGQCEVSKKYIYGMDIPSDCPFVEIITCKDCKHYYPDEDGRGYHCERDSNVRFSVYADFYCAGAERKV